MLVSLGATVVMIAATSLAALSDCLQMDRRSDRHHKFALASHGALTVRTYDP